MNFIKAVIIATLVMFTCSAVQAADKMIESKITSIKVLKDKNGNEYVRAIIQETRNLEGVKYDAGVPVMMFQDNATKGKTLKAGDTLHAVCDGREYNGRTSYTVRTFVE